MGAGSFRKIGSAHGGYYKPISHGTGGTYDRGSLLQSYEKEMSLALLWARLVASLHAVSRFLALCNLIWGSAVLLGAFASTLSHLDFTCISCLLLLEAARLASASFSTLLPTHPFTARLSQDPKRIVRGKDGRWPAAHYARICLQSLQLILISPSLSMSSNRIFTSSELNSYNANIRNLQNSLRIFHTLVALDSLTSLITLACSALAFVSLHKRSEQSILRYYNRVLENAMSVGIVQADDFEFFRFAYTVLASEYRLNVQPEAVAKNHKQLIQYLYAHRLGVDFLNNYMDADDAFVQLAAINMVGFWADTAWGVGLKELKLPKELLTKLADKVGTGQVGWAATNSVGALASRPGGAWLLARTQTSSGCSLPERLAELVDETSSRSLSLVRTLVIFYENLCMEEREVPQAVFGKGEGTKELVRKLKKLVRGASVQRLRVQAAYLLLMMGEECDPSAILAINPTQDAYWFQSEVDMLRLLRKHIPINDCVETSLDNVQVRRLTIRQDANISPPVWAYPTNTSQ